jgi:hypothetical protein
MDNSDDVLITADRLLAIADGVFCEKCHQIVVPDPYNPNYLVCRSECARVLEGSLMPTTWINTKVYHAKGLD